MSSNCAVKADKYAPAGSSPKIAGREDAVFFKIII